MDDNKPVLLTLHEALRLDLIEAYMAREITVRLKQQGCQNAALVFYDMPL